MPDVSLDPSHNPPQDRAITDDNISEQGYSYNVNSAASSEYALNKDVVKYQDTSAPSTPGYLDEKQDYYTVPQQRRTRKKILVYGSFGGLTIIAVAAVLIYFTVIKPRQDIKNGNRLAGGPTDGTDATNGVNVIFTGGDGSTVTKDDGSTFTYKNAFGGSWYWNPNDPFNNGARAQSWTPALNETFKYGVDHIRGVNIGGWLVTEPFIAPALFEKYKGNATDEWTLSENMRADTAGGGINQLEDHYKTFITEDDFAQIAAAGLNFVRIPIPYWAIETREGEPFLAKTSWTYFLKAIQWSRKYGIRINLDLHTLPGSQNGWNHSGKQGSTNVLNGPMGYANAQRSLDYIRIIAEFISQPEYKDVVVMFGITNEPQGTLVGLDVLQSYYLAAYNVVRKASGVGEGQGPFISYHDGFLSASEWDNFLPNADRISLDMHKYLCFGPQQTDPITQLTDLPCKAFGPGVNASMAGFGLTTTGEFSLAINDCGLYVNGVGQGTRYEGDVGGFDRIGSCDPFLAWQKWDDPTKKGYMAFAQSSMDAFQNWFFWTWKIGPSTVHNAVMAPHWSYQLGVQNGWMPADPRSATGKCGNTDPFVGELKPYQTGGAGAGQIPAAVTKGLPWPPAQLNNGGAVGDLPSYTPTGAPVTLPPPTFTVVSGKSTSTANAGSGWQNPADNAGMMVPMAGCSYLDPWAGGAPPSPLCTAAPAVKRGETLQPMITAFAA